ncbi:MAG: hypothetical protein ACD_60C00035G0008 [uncultured bacterium]|nr:MAG: hypothetical protein ACD_60C00035G0008 [uncultured bacterium]
MSYERPKTELSKAIPLILLAAFFNTLMVFFVKIVSTSVSTQLIVLVRYVITLIILMPFIYFNPAKQSMSSFLKTKRFPLHFVRDVFGLVSVLCSFYAAKNISLADATILFNTAPLFIPIVAFFWGGLKIMHRLWFGMGLGFLGVLLILHPGRELFHFAAVAGLFSGVFAAIAYVGGRYLTYSEPPLRNMFYYFIVGSLMALILVICSRENFSALFYPKVLLLLLAVGVFGYFYQWCSTHAARHAPVRLTSSFLYTSVIFSMFLDWFFWNVTPNLIAILGMLSIIGGACLLLFLYPKDDYQKRK